MVKDSSLLPPYCWMFLKQLLHFSCPETSLNDTRIQQPYIQALKVIPLVIPSRVQIGTARRTGPGKNICFHFTPTKEHASKPCYERILPRKFSGRYCYFDTRRHQRWGKSMSLTKKDLQDIKNENGGYCSWVIVEIEKICYIGDSESAIRS